MLMLPFLTTVLGIWMGMRFSIFAVIPATVLLVALFFITTPSTGAGHLAIQLVVLLCCNQVGYMAGLAAREPLSRLSLWFSIRHSKQI
jgi:drug/metabolite transporter (DMT)-like permease